jgi:hypothetical protein
MYNKSYSGEDQTIAVFFDLLLFGEINFSLHGWGSAM